MPFSHFSRVHKGITWTEVKMDQRLQIQNKCKRIKYTEVVCLSVNEGEFNNLCSDLSRMLPCYMTYGRYSITDCNGIWNCIVIQKVKSEDKIIIYTAGEVYPLYAGVSE